MESTLIIAKLFWPALMILAIAAMINQNMIDKMIKEASKSYVLIYLISVIRLIIGLVIVTFHNVWTWTLETTITLLGWLILISGVLGLLFPDDIKKLAKPVLKQKRAMQTAITLMFILGAALVYVWYGIS